MALDPSFEIIISKGYLGSLNRTVKATVGIFYFLALRSHCLTFGGG